MKTLWGVEESTQRNQYHRNGYKQELTWESGEQESVTSFMMCTCTCLTHLTQGGSAIPSHVSLLDHTGFGELNFHRGSCLYTSGFQNMHSRSCFHLTWEDSTFLIVTNELLSLSVF